MVFDSACFDPRTYTGCDRTPYLRRTRCSWEDVGWRSLLAQRFVHAPVVADLHTPATDDVHLVLAEAGHATMRTRIDGQRRRYDWMPGWLELIGPDRPAVFDYRADGPLRSVQVHIPRATVERTAERLGWAVDYEKMSVSLRAGDRLLEEAVRAVGMADEVGELYAESAGAFLATHLVTSHSGRDEVRVPVREDARVRGAIAIMRERLADPLTLADIAREVYLSVYHLVRVFKDKTGETPHRFLTRLRIEEAQRLLRGSDLPLADIAHRCGFGSPGALSSAFLRHTGTRPSTYRKS